MKEQTIETGLWEHLSELVIGSRHTKEPSSSNEALYYYEKNDPRSFMNPTYALWRGDSLVQEWRFKEAIAAYDHIVNKYPKLTMSGDAKGKAWASLALEQIAVCHERLGNIDGAITSYSRILKSFSKENSKAWIYFQTGSLYEENGNHQKATEFYHKAASSPNDTSDADWEIPDLAKRHAMRLENPGQQFSSSKQLAIALTRAIEKRNSDTLSSLISKTHFCVGVQGSEMRFADWKFVMSFIKKDIAKAKIMIDPYNLRGNGSKWYLTTEGWDGELLKGRLSFLLTESKYGWQWSGIVLTQPGKGWDKIFPPAKRQENQPLEITIKSPFQRGENWRAGGLNRFLESFNPFWGWVIFLEDNFSGCGYGPGGFYYNQGSTHRGSDAFSIDFTKYVPHLPYFFDSDNRLVLAVQQGVVSFVRSFVRGGNPDIDNRVEMRHAGPGDFARPIGSPPGPPMKYLSKYLHLNGPFMIPVSVGMLIRQGTRLGLTDDTGNSAFPHLHFSIHDRDIIVNGAGFGSVRPTPMDGQSLNDGNGGRCVGSSNVPFP